MVIEQNKSETILRECFHCGYRAPMEIVSTYNNYIEFGEPPYTDEDWYKWSILRCPYCKKLTLEENYRSAFDRDIDEWPWHTKILYPTTTHQPNIDNLPEDVKKEYESAFKVKNLEPNAFAVLIGRTLEAICKNQCAEGKTLEKKLNSLSVKNVIPVRVADMAKCLRDLRNIGAHADSGEIDQSYVPILIEFCEAILDYIYRVPARINMIQKRLDSYKKKP